MLAALRDRKFRDALGALKRRPYKFAGLRPTDLKIGHYNLRLVAWMAGLKAAASTPGRRANSSVRQD